MNASAAVKKQIKADREALLKTESSDMLTSPVGADGRLLAVPDSHQSINVRPACSACAGAIDFAKTALTCLVSLSCPFCRDLPAQFCAQGQPADNSPTINIQVAGANTAAPGTAGDRTTSAARHVSDTRSNDGSRKRGSTRSDRADSREDPDEVRGAGFYRSDRLSSGSQSASYKRRSMLGS